MQRSLLLVILGVLLFTNTVFTQSRSTDPRQVVIRSIDAMGGTQKLKAITMIHTRSVGYFNLLEQSERPEGPWYTINQETEEWRDLTNGNIRRTCSQNGVFTGTTTEIITNEASALDNDSGFGPNQNVIPQTQELLAMAPERVLFTALDASDLHYAGVADVQGTPNDIVAFTWRGGPVKLYLNQDTGLITLTDVVRARPFEQFWGIWGDFSVKNYYSYWDLQKGGFHYPQQVDTFYNDQPLRKDTITTIDFNTAVPDYFFLISDQVKKAFAESSNRSFLDTPLGRPNRPPVNIAPDFVVIPGNWNVTLVKQSDGIVIIEAPISSGYSAKVMDEVKKRYPKDRIKAVISTSDSFPHFGGLREYAAAGVPIYIVDKNAPIINRLMAAKYTTDKDTFENLAKHGSPRLNLVSKRTVIGTGPNELDLYPIRTETGERMMMIYAPQQKVLYGADLIQPQNGSFFMPQYLTELRDAAAREHLDVERVFAIHCPPIDWTKVLDVLKDSEK